MSSARDYAGWTKFVWLIYAVPFAAYPFAERILDPARATITVLATIFFLVIYLAAYRSQGRRLLAIIALITLLGVVFLPWNYGAGAFFIFAASFAGAAGGKRQPFIIVGVILLALLIEVSILDLSVAIWWWAALFTVAVGAVNVHFAQVGRTNARLQLAQDEIEHLAKVAERERIARDLHDLLGHTLSLIILKSELASKLAERDPLRAREEIRDVERISREALTQVRQAVRGYRGGGIQKELDAAREMATAGGIALTGEIDFSPLPPAHEAILALALREAVTNVVRHSHARQCSVTLALDDHHAVLTVVDDGRGGSQADGFGLSGMRERIAAVGGTVVREGSRGTTLTITLPHDPTRAPSSLVRSA
jgi:two-component system sensor histidine kinase DesK